MKKRLVLKDKYKLALIYLGTFAYAYFLVSFS